MQKTKTLLKKIIDEIEHDPNYNKPRIEPNAQNINLVIAQTATDATIELAHRILHSLDSEQDELIEKIKDNIAEIIFSNQNFDTDNKDEKIKAFLDGSTAAAKLILDDIKRLTTIAEKE